MSSNQPIQTAKFKVNIIKPYQLHDQGYNRMKILNWVAGQTVKKLLKLTQPQIG